MGEICFVLAFAGIFLPAHTLIFKLVVEIKLSMKVVKKKLRMNYTSDVFQSATER